MMRSVLPPQTAVTTDVGSHKIFMALNWGALMPNRYFVSNGLSCMGYGLPAAIAAALTTGDVAVCVTGDGGLAMNMGELSILDETKLPVIIILMNDAALNLIREGQLTSGYEVFGTEFVNPDYESIARAFGLTFYRIFNSAGFVRSLKEAVEARKPALIEVLIDPSGYLDIQGG
jgi:acetolactate synthase-1/2/3 large subunit